MEKKISKEQQDLVWRCLPKEAREQIKEFYQSEYCNRVVDELFDTVFGYHNLISDTELEEMLMVERKYIQEMYTDGVGTHYLLNLFGDKCLPDKEAEQLEPKKFFESDYSIGDKVIVCISSIGEPRKEVVTLIRHYQPQCEYNDYAKTWVIQTQDGQTFQSNEEHFEPYTETEKEAKETQNLSLSDEQSTENKETMEEKELNLCKLLKSCEGEEFYLVDCGNATLDGVQTNNSRGDNVTFLSFHSTKFDSGTIIINPNGKRKVYGSVILYPSRALFEKYPLDAPQAWREWADSRKPKYVLQAQLRLISNDGKTVEDCENVEVNTLDNDLTKAAEVVREALEKFHSNHTEQ